MTTAESHAFSCRFCGAPVQPPEPVEAWGVRPSDCEACGGRWPHLVKAERVRQLRARAAFVGALAASSLFVALAWWQGNLQT